MSKTHIACGTFVKPEDKELYDLAIASGVVVDPDVFSLLVDLLRLDISPTAIFTMLQSFATHYRPQTQQKKPNASGSRPVSISTPTRQKPSVTSKPSRKVNIAET